MLGPKKLAMALVMAAALPASLLAHEDEGAAARTAEAVAPGLTGLGVLLLIAIVVAVWYHLRKDAMLRAYRNAQNVSGASSEPRSEGP